MKWRKDTNLYIAVLITGLLIFAFLTLFVSSASKKEDTNISAKAATLYEPETGRFLYEKNADLRLPMASTTKIMTALVALESCELDETVEIAPEAIGIEGSSAYLKQGEVLTLEELLYALLLQSANDAAVAIAYHVSGDVDGFSDLMNERAEALGLSDTHFKNPHGLDDNEHYTSAHDLAIITAEALKNDTFKEITSTYKKRFVNGDRERNYVNHNKLLNRYSDCIGIKTGFTKKSGRCLVGAAEKNGLTFITVTLNDPNDWADHTRLFDLGFETLERVVLAEQYEYCYEIPVLGSSTENIKAKNTDELYFITEKKNCTVIPHIKLRKFVTAPIKCGDVMGEVVFTVDGEAVGSVKLISTEAADTKEKNGFWNRILSKAE